MVYIVMNGKLAPDFEVVRASTLPIVTRSFETSVRANTRNTLIASYQFAKSRNWEFNLASIDPDYPKASSPRFRPRLHAAIVRLRLSARERRKTVAMDAGRSRRRFDRALPNGSPVSSRPGHRHSARDCSFAAKVRIACSRSLVFCTLPLAVIPMVPKSSTIAK